MDLAPKCSRCGCSLKVEIVRIPILPEPQVTPIELDAIPNCNPPPQYQEREEVSDCPRCTGSY